MAGENLILRAACLCAFATACAPNESDNQIINEAPGNEANLIVEPEAVAPKVLDREPLLMAVAKAASAFALGADNSEAQRKLDGQQFEFRIRLGCDLASSSKIEPISVAFDEKKRVLRISFSPGVTATEPAVQAVAPDDVEAVEGFWVDQPWLLSVGCPAQAKPVETAEAVETIDRKGKAQVPKEMPTPKTEPVPLSRIGIAQFFSADDSRTLRRDNRAYQVTKTLDEGVSPSASGYDIVLAGRLRKLADGRVIACSASSPVSRPNCVVSAFFDHVAIRRGDNDELLAEWGGG